MAFWPESEFTEAQLRRMERKSRFYRVKFNAEALRVPKTALVGTRVSHAEEKRRILSLASEVIWRARRIRSSRCRERFYNRMLNRLRLYSWQRDVLLQRIVYKEIGLPSPRA